MSGVKLLKKLLEAFLYWPIWLPYNLLRSRKLNDKDTGNASAVLRSNYVTTLNYSITNWILICGTAVDCLRPKQRVANLMRVLSSALYTFSVKLSDFTVWRHTWRNDWVNCAVLTGIRADLRTILSSRSSHREMCSSLRESHSFLCLPADTTMASSQGTSVSSNSFSRRASHDIFLYKYLFLLHILRFLFFSDNITADVTSKQQTTPLFLSTIVARTRRHTELTKTKLKTLMGNLCCAREHSVQFFLQFFYTVKLHSLT
jgi:hypothetical protein